MDNAIYYKTIRKKKKVGVVTEVQATYFQYLKKNNNKKTFKNK